MIVINLCELSLKKVVFHSYPDFVPNEYLFTEYAKTLEGGDKMERWEIYASAVRDFMCKASGKPPGDQPIREMLMMKKFLWG